MKKTIVLRTIVMAMAVALAFSLCACGNAKNNEESSAPASQSELTPEQQVEQLVREEFTRTYGDDLEVCEFKNIKIYTAEEIAEDQVLFQDCQFNDTDIVFAATYDLKAPEGKSIKPLLPANGEEDGQWVRNKYVCGYLSLISEGKYKLESYGTSF